MIKETINNRVVELYTNIDTLPIVNFQKYNKYMLIDNIIGSGLTDTITAVARAIRYIELSKPDLAVVQLQNIINSISLASQNINPRYLAFAALVKSIDGVEVSDKSDEGFIRALERLNGGSRLQVENILNEVKKN